MSVSGTQAKFSKSKTFVIGSCCYINSAFMVIRCSLLFRKSLEFCWNNRTKWVSSQWGTTIALKNTADQTHGFPGCGGVEHWPPELHPRRHRRGLRGFHTGGQHSVSILWHVEDHLLLAHWRYGPVQHQLPSFWRAQVLVSVNVCKEGLFECRMWVHSLCAKYPELFGETKLTQWQTCLLFVIGYLSELLPDDPVKRWKMTIF